ncbi:hypothetical protein [Chromobacterium sphagni]|uniref:hypothetical protein n=1 Tax=Chromobacterium sphagni TaxID=1903179 RepID=UPI001113C141|nr:hypothetical protein [Chromobacterium sphagni]
MVFIDLLANDKGILFVCNILPDVPIGMAVDFRQRPCRVNAGMWAAYPSAIGLYCGLYRALPMLTKERIMSKSRHSTKEAKKQPLLSPKEKRAAKHQKKQAPEGAPIIVPH